MKPIYLVITPFFPTVESFRGPYVYDQVRALECDGRYHVVVLKPTSWLHREENYEYGGVKVYRFTTFDLPTNAWSGWGDSLSYRSFNKCLKRLNIDCDDIAVVHSHVTALGKFANFVKSKNPKCLTVLQHHGYDVLGVTDGRFAGKEWHRTHCINYGVNICNKIDLHVGVSQEILRYLGKYEGIMLRDKYVLYNGVDTSKFYPIGAKKKVDDIFRIGCVANFWELKDQITLIKSVEILIKNGMKKIKVSFVGTGYTRESCEQYVNENGLNDYFEFKNEVDHSQLNAYYNTLDLFVLPSYWDSFGCVYTEAYACGVPFMTARGTGITELIPEEDFFKWVIKPKDYVALTHNIMYYIDNRDKQILKTSIDIKVLVTEYLDYIQLKLHKYNIN